MSITERLQEAISGSSKRLSEDPNFGKLGEFYKHAKEAGFAKNQSYSLPQLDTTGKRLMTFQEMTKR